MTELQATKSRPATGGKTADGRLFVLELSGGRIHSMNPDGSDRKTIVTDCRLPGRHRGRCRKPVISTGPTWVSQTERRLDRARRPRRKESQDHRSARRHLTRQSRSSSIRRAASSTGATAKACASCAPISTVRSSKPSSRRARAIPDRGRMRPSGASASPSIPSGGRSTGRRKARTTPAWAASSAPTSKSRTAKAPPTAATSKCCIDGLPEPIDLELDLENRVLYWTDRGDPPRGNTVNRASIDAKPIPNPEIVLTHLMEGIGIALDVPGDRMFVTDFAGSIYSANLDGSGRAKLSLRPGQPHRHRLRRNLKIASKGELTMSTPSLFAASPSSAPASSARAGRRCSWRKAWRSWRPMSRRMRKPP